MAAARNETDREQTSQQLDAFHKTFNFCMTCRQYTCGNCWNEAEGRCLSCAPSLGQEVMPRAVRYRRGGRRDHVQRQSEADRAPGSQWARGAGAQDAPLAWPTSDLMRQAEAAAAPPPLEIAEEPVQAEPPPAPDEADTPVTPVAAGAVRARTPAAAFEAEPPQVTPVADVPAAHVDAEPVAEAPFRRPQRPRRRRRAIDFAARLAAVSGPAAAVAGPSTDAVPEEITPEPITFDAPAEPDRPVVVEPFQPLPAVEAAGRPRSRLQPQRRQPPRRNPPTRSRRSSRRSTTAPLRPLPTRRTCCSGSDRARASTMRSRHTNARTLTPWRQRPNRSLRPRPLRAVRTRPSPQPEPVVPIAAAHEPVDVYPEPEPEPVEAFEPPARDRARSWTGDRRGGTGTGGSTGRAAGVAAPSDRPGVRCSRAGAGARACRRRAGAGARACRRRAGAEPSPPRRLAARRAEPGSRFRPAADVADRRPRQPPVVETPIAPTQQPASPRPTRSPRAPSRSGPRSPSGRRANPRGPAVPRSARGRDRRDRSAVGRIGPGGRTGRPGAATRPSTASSRASVADCRSRRTPGSAAVAGLARADRPRPRPEISRRPPRPQALHHGTTRHRRSILRLRP